MERVASFELFDIGDAHVHFRQDKRKKDGVIQRTDLLSFSVPLTACWASFSLPMPNTTPSVQTGFDAIKYERQIKRASDGYSMYVIKCIKAVEGFTTPEVIREAKAKRVDAIKIYFEGMTTNANKGDAVTWEGFFNMADVWKTCAEVDMVISVHFEKPGVFCLDREYEAIREALVWLAELCPNARIVAEHITDHRSLEIINSLPENVRYTSTAHHLWGDLDLVIGGSLNAHAFCKPVLKYPMDCKALRYDAFRKGSKAMFGSDTAPHPLEDKECEGCAGAFTGPYCVQMIATILLREGYSLPEIKAIMQSYMGIRARYFYRVPRPGRKATLVRQKMTIPTILHAETGFPVVPFQAGSELEFSLAV